MTRQLALGVLVSLILRDKPVKMKRSQHTILISEVTNVASRLGFSNVKPMVLRDAGNLIVHLSPFPIVARVAGCLKVTIRIFGGQSGVTKSRWLLTS